MLAEPRDAPDRAVPGPARRHADPHAGRPAAGPAQPARRRRRRWRHPARARAPRASGRFAGSAAASSSSARSRETSPSSGPRRRTSPRCSAGAGYEVGYKGKWHLTHPRATARCSAAGRPPTPSGCDATTASPTGSRRTPARTPRPSTSAPATPARSARAGTRSTRARPSAGSAAPDLPEPFCLVVSLVNPHDVLGYPAQYVGGGYCASGVPRPRRRAPADPGRGHAKQAHRPRADADGDDGLPGAAERRRGPSSTTSTSTPTSIGWSTSRSGGSSTRSATRRTRRSLRSRTVIFRCADHGEMGLSHGGLRQKAFNAYEETIHVPLVISNPVLFPRARAETDAFASLIDLLPTSPDRRRRSGRRSTARGAATCHRSSPSGGARRRAASTRPRSTSSSIADHPAPGAVGPGRDPLHLRRPPGGHRAPGRAGPAEPDPRRADRARQSSRSTSTPTAGAPTEYEMYDLERDPDEAPQPRRPHHRRAARRLPTVRCAPSSASDSMR